ncbi:MULTISPECIES: DeoR/GlpR family DNA-binding transcription regulator [Roseobacteraceae]|uniref:Transcriptional regulator, DeoR family n=1 Tax=Alloyangia pacifica TaxID=311180 RepID=A0A1I6W5Z7_9RHOB|nr:MULTISPECIES: DeoR/GlpR family DNA-binding transcription regulator [Roseobacteraceae]SDI67143.1 transcriptional regulator, DeoR family [Alloyangia pacifica]SFT21437.1 transcriptional regulator, DeoR family [Alloyangia pacifica]
MRKSEDTLNEEMLPAERRQHLIDWFKQNQAGSGQDLARMLGISVSTIRRDLDVLAGEGLVRRTHGGAVAIRSRSSYEPSTDLSQRTAVEEKLAIVREALTLIEPGQSLLIDTGAVICHRLADEIAKIEFPLTVITNDLYVAKQLTYRDNITLIVPGGACRVGSFSLLGEPGLGFLKNIHCDIFFTSATAIDENGTSETNLELGHMKRAMAAAAREVVLIADSSRFMSCALHRTVPINSIDLIITDAGLLEEDRAKFPPHKPRFKTIDRTQVAVPDADDIGPNTPS